MNARRWPPLWIFLAGCASGALFIGLSSEGDAGSDARTHEHEPSATAQQVSTAGTGPTDRAARSSDDSESDRPPERDGKDPGANLQAANAEPHQQSHGQPGYSLADVLARLEAQYRAAPRDVARPVANTEAHEPAEAPERNDRDVVAGNAAAAPAPALVESSQPRSSEVRSVTVVPSVSTGAPRVAAEEPSRRVAGTGDAPEASSVRQVQASTAQELQQLATLQQIALVQQLATAQQLATLQQLVLLQYLQPVQAARSPRVASSPPVLRLPANGLFVAFPGSSAHALDRGSFPFSPTVLVR